MTRLCLFGAYDPEYPRVRIFREALTRAGVEVLEARVPEHRAFRRYPALVSAFARLAERADAILVPAFRHKDVPLARWLAGDRPLIFDPLVSRHDTLVGDWGLHREGSRQARWNRALDRWSLSLPDLVLCDTWAHGRLFESLGVPRERLHRVLVGAEDAFFAIGAPPSRTPVRIAYLGGFLPLHGVPTVIEALATLERDAAQLPDFRVEMVGEGIEFGRARAEAERAGLTRIAFRGAVPYRDAPRVFEEADIVLGAFGTSAKAGRVIPHKVFQGLAAGRAVLTGDGSGLREAFEPGVHLAVVPRGDAPALARMLRELIADGPRRAELGRAGRARAREIGTPERLGADLREAMESLTRSMA